jgi:Mg/Co/Ni transporter MgtE
LAHLHPAQLADLTEAGPHAQGEEILQAIAYDKPPEAEVFEQLHGRHPKEFLGKRTDADVAAVLSRLASDNAAHLLLELDQSRRLSVLSACRLASAER